MARIELYRPKSKKNEYYKLNDINHKIDYLIKLVNTLVRKVEGL